jgi:hypothetical protein
VSAQAERAGEIGSGFPLAFLAQAAAGSMPFAGALWLRLR